MVRFLSIAASLCLALPFTLAYDKGQSVFESFGHEEHNTPEKHIHRLLSHHPVVDTHNDLPMNLAFEFNGKINHLNFTRFDWGHTDIERLRQGQLGGQFWSVYFDCDNPSNQVLKALESIDVVKRLAKLYPNDFEFVTDSQQFERALHRGRIASALGMEGGQMIDSSLAALRQFYDLGIRYLTLTHNCHTPWAESCCDPQDPPFEKGIGLTQFGKDVILEMNRLGMMVDISHVAHSTMAAVLDVTQAPVLFSHSSSYSICNVTRNVPDKILERLKQTDGVVMVNFYNGFVQCDPTKETTVADVADHVDYIASVAGYDRVGLGADYNGVEKTPKGLEDVSTYPNLFLELAKRGWSDDQLIGLTGRNFLRVWRKVEQVKKRLARLNQLPLESVLEDYN